MVGSIPVQTASFAETEKRLVFQISLRMLCAKGRTDAGNGSNWRVQGAHDLSDFAVHFSDLLFQEIEAFCIELNHYTKDVASHTEAKGIACKIL